MSRCVGAVLLVLTAGCVQGTVHAQSAEGPLRPNVVLVLVDEAHNFRNLTRRHRALTEYLEGGEHKVVLLSATPQNLGPRDIYRQLRLFLDEVDHGLNLEPLALEDYFSAITPSSVLCALIQSQSSGTPIPGPSGAQTLPSLSIPSRSSLYPRYIGGFVDLTLGCTSPSS